MSSTLSRRVIALTVAGGIALTAAAGPAAAAAPDGLAELAQRTVDAGAPGVVVRVGTGHGPPVELARQAPWTTADHRLSPGDELRVGSNTKTMVATMVLQLVAENRLSLADPVEKWLPGRVPGGGAITLRMLLNHTSGLFDNTDDEEVLESVFGLRQRPWTADRLLAAGTRHPALFPPGEKWSYSNTNYVALGLVLEKATGRTLPALFRQRLFQPLGLRDTYYGSPDRRKLAHGYEPDAAHLKELIPDLPDGFRFVGPEHDGHADVTGIDPDWAGAAGGVVSTARDWDRFLTALLSGRLLPPAQLREMKTMIPADPAHPEAGSYGLGLARLDTPCGPVYGHTGGIPGYRSDLFTDSTGSRSVEVFVTEQQGLAEPDLAAAHQALVTGAVCAMYGKTSP
ncbi:serine hydrolase domain-containing protein [Amycolatopsis sp., V23-08]|uniref:Serine hydrolase domain-containing protein n=1 Tax=Amycolatopsis heterodermiae TaxID=3110235 RepID=A0ABU5RIG8_9PSEU|nr:serine hydrolase domain-containing protein [Amycolatopsis sp., V23-08]MEA5365365.1 serine hydrolase domain-containing protein [Amycolatopsis sp., V23-08]